METFRPVVGYEGLYEVSDMGRVRSFKRTNPIIMKPTRTRQGYLKVFLCRAGQSKESRVHRLVAEAFIPNPDDLPYTNHKNGIKDDNRLNNLEWCTPAYNMRHAVDTGLKVAAKGDDTFNGKKNMCLNGHPLSGENLYIQGPGYRECRICKRRRNLISYHKRRARKPAAIDTYTNNIKVGKK